MGPFALLALLTGALALGVSDDGGNGSDSDDPETDDTPDDPVVEESPEDLDVGATFDFDEAANTVTLDIGADETGQLGNPRGRSWRVPRRHAI